MATFHRLVSNIASSIHASGMRGRCVPLRTLNCCFFEGNVSFSSGVLLFSYFYLLFRSFYKAMGHSSFPVLSPLCSSCLEFNCILGIAKSDILLSSHLLGQIFVKHLKNQTPASVNSCKIKAWALPPLSCSFLLHGARFTP